jgi:hypothetical protein
MSFRRMFEYHIHTRSLPKSNKPTRIAARQAHWLQVAFKRYLEIVGEDIGCEFTLDGAKLSTCFVGWLRAIAAQKPKDRALRRQYFEFSAGLMLRELMRNMPISVDHPPEKVSANEPAGFWPEGVACAMFCLAVLYAVEAEEFGVTTEDVAEVHDLRFWWSFKENAIQDPRYAVAFFERLIGVEPNWELPDFFRAKLLKKSEI